MAGSTEADLNIRRLHETDTVGIYVCISFRIKIGCQEVYFCGDVQIRLRCCAIPLSQKRQICFCYIKSQDLIMY